jgi:predicted DNA binding CopG/RHH family protein
MRKIISLTEAQVEKIKREASLRGISQTEIIRRMVDQCLP